MRRDLLRNHFLISFAFALIVYAIAYGFIEHRRVRRGGWAVTFQTDAHGSPSVSVSHPRLGVKRYALQFPDDHVDMTNLSQTFVFDQPLTNIPFGKVIYLDTTFLPGSVVFELFGHEIQLVPRTLVVDRHERAWQVEETASLRRKNNEALPNAKVR